MSTLLPVHHRYVCVHASDLAAFAGRHKYRPRDECLLQYLKTLDAAAYQRQGRIVRDDRGKALLQEVIATVPEIAQSIKDASETCARESTTNSDASRVAEQTLATIDHALDGRHVDDAAKELLKEHCRSKIYTEYGTHKEAAVTDAVRRVAPAQTVITKDDVYRKRVLFDFVGDDKSRWRVFVGGKCDGLMKDASTGRAKIVEIKNRMKRLFRSVPEYERVQVLAYLYIHDLHDAILVENYNGETCEHAIEFDETYWQGVVDDLRQGMADLFNMMRDARQVQE